MARATAKAREAGYEMKADKAEIHMWEVELRGVRLSGQKIDMKAETVRVAYDGRMRAGDIIVEGADVTVKETRREPGGGGRRKISVLNSMIRVKRTEFQATATVRRAVLDREGRVWADMDVIAKSGKMTVDARDLRADGMKPEESMDVRAKSVSVKIENESTEETRTGRTGPAVPSSLLTDELTVDADGVHAEAHGVKADVSTAGEEKTYHVEADTVLVGDNSAEQVMMNVRRNTSTPEETRVEMTAESLETENRKLSSAEFSVRKLWAKATLVRQEGNVSVREATVRIGGARMNVSASMSANEASLKAEMPEVECQELLDSLPRELVPRLIPQEGEGTKMSGTISWRTEVWVDLPARKKPDVSIWLKNKCIVESVPEELNVQRLRRPFRHEEYTAYGKKTVETMGPGTANWVPLSSISALMPVSVMAMEDPSFMSHRGILVQAIENSMEQNMSAGKFVRGGSTISMQLAKNLWLAREKTISRKIQEAVLTTYLEQKLSKTQIIELYLNIVEFGPNLYGIGPASRHYFAKDPGSLSLSQSLFLASLLPSPKSAGFEEGKKVSQGRLELLRKVMKMMLDRGTIGPAQYEQGLKETPVFGEPSSSGETETEPRSPGGIDPSEWK